MFGLLKGSQSSRKVRLASRPQASGTFELPQAKGEGERPIQRPVRVGSSDNPEKAGSGSGAGDLYDFVGLTGAPKQPHQSAQPVTLSSEERLRAIVESLDRGGKSRIPVPKPSPGQRNSDDRDSDRKRSDSQADHKVSDSQQLRTSLQSKIPAPDLRSQRSSAEFFVASGKESSGTAGKQQQRYRGADDDSSNESVDSDRARAGAWAGKAKDGPSLYDLADVHVSPVFPKHLKGAVQEERPRVQANNGSTVTRGQASGQSGLFTFQSGGAVKARYDVVLGESEFGSSGKSSRSTAQTQRAWGETVSEGARRNPSPSREADRTPHSSSGAGISSAASSKSGGDGLRGPPVYRHGSPAPRVSRKASGPPPTSGNTRSGPSVSTNRSGASVTSTSSAGGRSASSGSQQSQQQSWRTNTPQRKSTEGSRTSASGSRSSSPMQAPRVESGRSDSATRNRNRSDNDYREFSGGGATTATGISRIGSNGSMNSDPSDSSGRPAKPNSASQTPDRPQRTGTPNRQWRI